MALSILFSRIDLPSTTQDGECSLLYGRNVEAYSLKRQYQVRLLELANDGSTAEELDAYVDDMLLNTCLVVHTRCIALGIGVFIDGSDITVFLQSIDVGRYRHIEGGFLNWNLALDVEVQLIVRNLRHHCFIDDSSYEYTISYCIRMSWI